MALAHTVSDHFAAGVGSLWTTGGVGVTWVDDGGGSGHVEMSITTTLYYIATVGAHDLRNSLYLAKVSFPATDPGTIQSEVAGAPTATDSSNRCRWYRNGVSDIQCILITAGSTVGTPKTVTYNAATMAYLGFQVVTATGKLQWIRSANGRDIVVEHEQDTMTWGNSGEQVHYRVRAFRSSGSPSGLATLDDLNYPPWHTPRFIRRPSGLIAPVPSPRAVFTA